MCNCLTCQFLFIGSVHHHFLSEKYLLPAQGVLYYHLHTFLGSSVCWLFLCVVEQSTDSCRLLLYLYKSLSRGFSFTLILYNKKTLVVIVYLVYDVNGSHEASEVNRKKQHILLNMFIYSNPFHCKHFMVRP